MSIAPQLGRDFLPTSTLDAELLSDVSSTCCIQYMLSCHHEFTCVCPVVSRKRFLVVNYLFWLFTFFPISLSPRKGKSVIQVSHLGKYHLGLIIPKFLMFCSLINCDVLVARVLLKQYECFASFQGR